MKTIKIIDLLIKNANGEEMPKKIKINNIVYEYRDYMYCTEKANYQDIEDYLFGKWNFNILNEEAEILEDEKKIPERLKIEQDTSSSNFYIKNEFGTKCSLTKHSKIFADKINEILDYLKSH